MGFDICFFLLVMSEIHSVLGLMFNSSVVVQDITINRLLMYVPILGT